MMNKSRKLISQLTDKELLLNLFLTQGILLLIALVSCYFVFPSWSDLLSLFRLNFFEILLWGGSVSIMIVFFDFLLYRFVPKHLIDDGGINNRVFSNRKVWQIILLCAFIAFVEELLFRGILQTVFGLYFTSIFFAVIHIRYLKSIVLFTVIVLVSFILGSLFLMTNNLLVPMFAHFLIDSILGIVIMIKHRKKLETCDDIKR